MANSVRNIAPFINENFTITSKWWKERINPVTHEVQIHRGLDITTGRTSLVYSMLNGIVHSKGYDDRDFDIRMCYWGDGTAGKILKDDEHYSAEYKIKINNEEKREEIIRVLSTFDWKEYLNCIAMRKIQQFHIVDVLKQNVEGIK